MNKLFFVFVGTGLVSTLTFGSYVRGEAHDVVVRSNIVTISKHLEYYRIFNNSYPKDLNELKKEEGFPEVGNDYQYLRSGNGSEAVILGVSDTKFYCWNSEKQAVFEVDSQVSCSI